jgi:putative ABC transport system permease protein
MFLKVAISSLLSRKGSAVMTLMAISVAIFVLLGIEQIRQQARDSFASTVSGVDLIVGAKTGSLNLLLYSVFRIGSPTDNISWQAYSDIAKSDDVAWAIPISLGDSHEGYRVVGTTQAFFEHFSFGKQRRLAFAGGAAFEGTFDAVLGSEVASALGYTVGTKIILAHGLASTSFTKHENQPFVVAGVLAATGTPVDQTIHVPLEGIEAMHAGRSNLPIGAFAPASTVATNFSQPESITAFMLGLKSRLSTFNVQRQINQFKGEPLMAILPGVALSELWQMMSMFENVLRLISALVLLAAVLGMGAVLLSSIRERQQEIHLLRMMGASPLYLFFLIEMEAVILCALGMLLGGASLYLGLILLGDAMFSRFGLYLDATLLTPQAALMLGVVLIATLLAAAAPSLRMYTAAKQVS